MQRPGYRPFIGSALVIISSGMLAGCGGGDGGGTGTTGSSSGAGAADVLAFSTSSLSATSPDLNTGADLRAPLTITVSNASASAYYYVISFAGTAISSLSLDYGGSIKQNTGNASISGPGTMAQPIGATLSGSFQA